MISYLVVQTILLNQKKNQESAIVVQLPVMHAAPSYFSISLSVYLWN